MTHRSSLLLLLATACGEGESIAEHEVAVAVRRYNQALTMAYARAAPELLDGRATRAEMQRVADTIGFLAQGGRVMDARQETFQQGEVRFAGDDRATIEAAETWWYRHRVPNTDDIRQAPRRVRYETRYHLTRVEGRWVVDRLEETGFEDIGLEPSAEAR